MPLWSVSFEGAFAWVLSLLWWKKPDEKEVKGQRPYFWLTVWGTQSIMTLTLWWQEPAAGIPQLLTPLWCEDREQARVQTSRWHTSFSKPQPSKSSTVSQKQFHPLGLWVCVQTHASWDISYTNQNRPGAEAACSDPGKCLSLRSLPCYWGNFPSDAEHQACSSLSSWWQTEPHGVLPQGGLCGPASPSSLTSCAKSLWGELFNVITFPIIFGRSLKKYRT